MSSMLLHTHVPHSQGIINTPIVAVGLTTVKVRTCQ
jgi:hypothetical protein